MFRGRSHKLSETTVSLAAVALEDMLWEAERAAPEETGGMLLGYGVPRSNPGHIVVESVIGPGPRAKHYEDRFEPDGEWQQQRLAEVYEESGRTTSYLGDWHTHPKGPPTPSRRDRKTARRIARCKAARAPRPLMLILALKDGAEWWSAMYRWDARELRTVEVTRPS